MKLKEWLSLLCGDNIKGFAFSNFAMPDLDQDNTTLLEIEMESSNLGKSKLCLGSDGESVILSNDPLMEIDLEDSGKIIVSNYIKDFDVGRVRGKTITESSCFTSGEYIIGLELVFFDGSWLQIFNNGDNFALIIDGELPPTREAGVSKVRVC